jgi:hypothetical protein
MRAGMVPTLQTHVAATALLESKQSGRCSCGVLDTVRWNDELCLQEEPSVTCEHPRAEMVYPQTLPTSSRHKKSRWNISYHYINGGYKGGAKSQAALVSVCPRASAWSRRRQCLRPSLHEPDIVLGAVAVRDEAPGMEHQLRNG